MIEGFVVFLVLFLVFYVPIAIVRGIKKSQAEERGRQARDRIVSKKRQRRNDKKRDYDFLLNELETHPNNPKIRRRCLEAGREYARMCREDGLETTFDELAIKNDIDAACAAVSVASDPAEDYELILPSEIAKANAPAAQPVSKPAKRKTSKVAWGCLFLLLAPCFIGLVTRPQSTTENKPGQIVSAQVKLEKRSQKPSRPESSIPPAVAEVVPNVNSQPKAMEEKATKRESLTWKTLFAGVEKLGFRPSVQWKKSKVEKGWIGIYHLSNADAPDDVLNEASFQIVGDNGRKISKVVVEAEIYDRNHKETTINNTAACLKLLEAPPTVIEALRSEKTTKVGRWQITRRPHPQGGGYDIECARTYGTTSKEKGKPKPDVKPKAKAASDQASYIKQYRKKLNENGLNNRIITRLSGSGKKATITVVDAWSGMSHNERYQAASTLYKLWAIIASPKSPDAAGISIIDQNGTEIGGSRVWAGSLIWVSD